VLLDDRDKWLVEDNEIQYVSSLRQWKRLSTQHREASNSVVVAMSHEVESAKEGAVDSLLAMLGLRSVSCDVLKGIESFPPLPGVKKEGQSVYHLLDSRKEKAQLFVDGQLHHRDFLELKHPKVFHLATHGWSLTNCDELNGEDSDINPLLLSGISLAKSAKEAKISKENLKKGKDGDSSLLTAYEIGQMNLSGTDLVTLSACESGLGNSLPGEGVFGLRRAFEHAGARCIVMSLWKVPDRETALLMTNFYQSLLAGKGKSESLRRATLTSLQRSKREHGVEHPFFWSGFIAVGDNGPLSSAD
jgi:CHAT domain-containing protein